MKPLEDHERALLLVTRDGARPAAAFEALLEHRDVVAHQFPAPWDFERAGVDLLAAMPGLDVIRRENLDDVLERLVALHTPRLLEALCRETWRAVDERVRSFHLQRSILATFAGILRVGPRTADLDPPPPFVEDQVFIHGFKMNYRLRRKRGEERLLHAPEEEGSLVLYPFDPPNRVGRREAGLEEEGRGPVHELFAYQSGRDRHRRVLEDVARRKGWTVAEGA
ncbi:MAG: hypothetical protein ACC662_05170 [Planctomycetota bacterium]